MKKIVNTFWDKLIELSIEKAILIFVIASGISVTIILKFTKTILGQTLVLTISQLLAFIVLEIFVIMFIVFLRKKLKLSQKFKAGNTVTLSTKDFPVMSVGKFNFITNKVSCSWTHNGEVKQQWINQNQLLEYEPIQNTQVPNKRSPFWDRDNK